MSGFGLDEALGRAGTGSFSLNDAMGRTAPPARVPGWNGDPTPPARAVDDAAPSVWERVGQIAGRRIHGMASGLDSVAAAGARAVGWDSLANSAAELARVNRQRADTPVEGTTSWEDVKAAPTIGKVGRFALEQGLGSTPDMVLAVGALPAYVGLRSGEIGQQRAANSGEQDAGVGDIAAAVPAAAASALLERFGAHGILAAPAKGLAAGMAKAALREGATEFGQSVTENAGETVGTKVGFNPMVAADQGFAGLVAGAPFGGAAHGTLHATGRLREHLRGRGINTDGVPDDALVARTLDGSIGETGMTPDQVHTILQGGGATGLDQFSTPELAAAAAQRLEAARASPAPNLSSGMPAGLGSKKWAAFIDGAAPVRRAVPDDVSIIAAPEGAIRSDDAGGIAGVERHRAADASVIDDAQARAADDPVVASILDSNLSPRAKIATVWDRINKVRDTNAAAAGPDLPDVPPAPRLNPYTAPTVDEARAPVAQTFMDRVRGRESGGNDAARSSTSSATGRYQFTDATWLQQYKARFGGDGLTDAQILAKRGNGALQDTLMRDLTDGNAKALRSAGFEPSDGNLYLSHFLGRGGALRALRADPETPIVNLVGAKVVEANRSILEGKTVRDVIAWTHERMGGRPPAEPLPYRAGDYSGARGGTGDGYSFDAIDANSRLREAGTANRGEAELPETFADREAREATGGEMATGASTRPFRAGPERAEFEADVTARAEQATKQAQENLEAEWARRAQERQESAASGGFARQAERGEAASAGDPSGLYRGKYDQRPHMAGEAWSMTPEGFVAGKEGRPVAFRNAREAAKWAAANKMGGDFELHSWGGEKDNARVVLRRRDGSTYGAGGDISRSPAQGAGFDAATPPAGRSVDGSQRLLGRADDDARVEPDLPDAPPGDGVGPAIEQGRRAGQAGSNVDLGTSIRLGEPAAHAAVWDEARPARTIQPERTAANVGEARRVARDTLVGRPIRNEATGIEATVSQATLAKMTSASAMKKSSSPADHLLAVTNADHLFRSAELISRNPDPRGEPTLAISRWRAQIATPEGERSVKLTVKETSHPGSPNPLYTVETANVEPALLAPPRSGIERGPGQDRFPRQAGSDADMGAAPRAVDPSFRAAQPRELAPPGDVVTARGRRVETRWAVREAADLVDSSRPEFDRSLQPRDRFGRGSSDVQVAQIAGNLDPEQLHDSRLASQGAPIVGPDGMVESGNGRVAAIRRAYAEHPERAAEYRRMIERRGHDVSGLREPVLVRSRSSDMSVDDRRAWVREANERDTMAMSSSETARADADALADDALGLFRGGAVTDARNSDFVRAFMRDVVGDADRNAMIAPDGSLSIDGKRRIEGSILAKAFPDAGLVQKIVEDTDTNIRAIGAAMLSSAPDIARLRAAIRRGDVPALLDVSGNVVDMARTISHARDTGARIGDVLAQQDAFSRIAPETESLIRAVYNETLTRARSGEKLADVLRAYVAEAEKVDGGQGLFGAEVPPVSKGDIVDAARRKVEGRGQAGLFKSVDPGARDRPGGGERPAGPEPSRGGGQAEEADGRVASAGTADDRETLSRLLRAEQQDPALVDDMIGKGLMELAPGASRPRVTVAGRKLLNPETIAGRRAAPDGEAGFVTVDMLTAPFRFADWSKVAADATALTSRIRSIYGAPRAAARGALDRLSEFIGPLAYSVDGRLRSLAAIHDAPTIAELADLFHAPAGKDAGIGRTCHEAVERASRTRVQRAYDALEPFIGNDAALGRIRDLLARPRATIRARPEEHAAAVSIRDLLKDTLEYRRDAGEDLGEVTEGYFPRVIAAELVAKAPAKFKRAAERLYRGTGLSVADAAGAADAWALRIMDSYAGLDGGLDHARATTKPNSAKAREFGREADELLRDFYEPDTFSVLSRYILGSVRRAEDLRRFGAKGRVGSPERAAWAQQHGDKDQWAVMVDRIKGELRAGAGDADGVVKTVHHLRDVNLGTAYKPAGAIVSGLHLWNQLGVMDRATVSSLGDLAMGFVRAGPRGGFEHLRTSLSEIGQRIARADPSDARRYAEAVGTANDAFASVLLQARADSHVGAGTAQVLDKFYRATGLQQFTEAGRIAATKTGRTFLSTLASDLTSPTARTRARAGGYLRELGVSDPERFGAKLRAGEPTRDDLLADKGFAADYSTALLRFANQTVIAPSRAEKPGWASHPVGGLFFALQGYSWAFTKNVLHRAGRLSVSATKERDAALLAPAAGLLMLAGTTYLTDTFLRPFLFGSRYDFGAESWSDAILRTADRAGFTGGLSPVVNAFKGIKYRRSIADSLAGSVSGRIMDGMGKVGALATDANSPTTNTAERNAAGAVYDLVVEPALDLGAVRYGRGAAATAGVLATGQRGDGGVMPNDREAFVSRVVGAKAE